MAEPSTDDPVEFSDPQDLFEHVLTKSEQKVLAAKDEIMVNGEALHESVVKRLESALLNLGFYGGKFDMSAFNQYAHGSFDALLGTSPNATKEMDGAHGTIFTARKAWHSKDKWIADMDISQILTLEAFARTHTAMKECIQAAVDDAVNSVHFEMRLRLTTEQLLTQAISGAINKKNVMDIEVPTIMNSAMTQEEWRRFGVDFILRLHESPFIIMAINADKKLYDPQAAVEDIRIAMNPGRYDKRQLPESAFPGLAHADRTPTFPCRILSASDVFIEKYVCSHTGKDEYRARPRTTLAVYLVQMGWELMVYTGARTIIYDIESGPEAGTYDFAGAGNQSKHPGLNTFHGPFDAFVEAWAKTNAYEDFQLSTTAANAREAILIEQPTPILQGLENMTDQERLNVVRQRSERSVQQAQGLAAGEKHSPMGPQLSAAPVQGVVEFTLQDQERLNESRLHRAWSMGDESNAAMTRFSNASGGFRRDGPVPRMDSNWHDTSQNDPITPRSRTLAEITEHKWRQLHARSANLQANPYQWLASVRADLPIGTKMGVHIRPQYTGPDVNEARQFIDANIKAMFKINDIRLQRGGGKASFSITSSSSGRASSAKSDAAVRIEMQTWEDRVLSYRRDVAMAIIWVYEEIVALQERQAARQRAREQYYWIGVQMKMLLEAAEECQKMHEKFRAEFAKLDKKESGFVQKCNVLLKQLREAKDEALLKQSNYRIMVQNLIIALLQSNGLVTLEMSVKEIPVLQPEGGKSTAIASSSGGRDTTMDEPQAKKAKTGDIGKREMETMKEDEEEGVMLQARAKAFGGKGGKKK